MTLKNRVGAALWYNIGMGKHQQHRLIDNIKTVTGNIKTVTDNIKTVTELKSPEELRRATEYSVRGFRAVLFGEKAFRTDIVVFVAATVAAALMPVTWCERALLIYSVFMVLMAEIINTAIETVVNRISLEYHELSGRAKDIGSALVFCTFFGAGICWALVVTGILVRKYA